MSVISLKEISGISIDANMDKMVTTALARFSRHISEQEHHIDLLALYAQLSEFDPFLIQLKNIREQRVTELPILHPLTDIALAYELLTRCRYLTDRF